MLMPSIFGENLFDDFFEDFARPVRRMRRDQNQTAPLMRTDVKENESGYEIHIELPGYKKEEVKAELKDGTLTITAATDSEKEKKDENGRFIRKERYSGACSRSFYVGDAIEQTDIRAKFEDGILKLFVPKKEEKPTVEEKKYITIES